MISHGRSGPCFESHLPAPYFLLSPPYLAFALGPPSPIKRICVFGGSVGRGDPNPKETLIYCHHRQATGNPTPNIHSSSSIILSQYAARSYNKITQHSSLTPYSARALLHRAAARACPLQQSTKHSSSAPVQRQLPRGLFQSPHCSLTYSDWGVGVPPPSW